MAEEQPPAPQETPEGDAEENPADAPNESVEAEPAIDDASTDGGRVMDNQAEAADLLSDIPLQLMIELGRVPMNADEVVGLKVGHVIDLNKQAGEPLDLSVNGKVVARGEVVEIDGALGIRIVALAG
jgi:type III secretion system YscQ/HrcQ family protein